jgi:hypothetical protein
MPTFDFGDDLDNESRPKLIGGQRRLAALLDRQDDAAQVMINAYDRDVAPHIGPDDELPRLYRTTQHRPGSSPIIKEIALYVGWARTRIFIWCAAEVRWCAAEVRWCERHPTDPDMWDLTDLDLSADGLP